MAARSPVIELRPDAYALVRHEAERRGIPLEQVVDEIVRADLGQPAKVDLDSVLRRAAELRSRLPATDGVALARASRADLEARGT